MTDTSTMAIDTGAGADMTVSSFARSIRRAAEALWHAN
jgi:hypothetical protein